jgi:hypothetical protein
MGCFRLVVFCVSWPTADFHHGQTGRFICEHDAFLQVLKR